MSTIPPEGEPENAPDPLSTHPDSLPAARLKFTQESQYDIAIPDLTVRKCEFHLPEPPVPVELELPREIARHLNWVMGGIRGEIFNRGPGPAEAFDVRVTFARSDWDQATRSFRPVGPPLVRTSSFAGLQPRHHIPLHYFLWSQPRVDGRLYTAVIEVNPMTAAHPLGKVVEWDYTNNRCGCTWIDHPGWRRPPDPIGEPAELPEPLRGGGDWILKGPGGADPSGPGKKTKY